MKKFLSPGVILLLILVSLSVPAWIGYNRLVGLDEGVTAAWSQVQNVYQRRADLIPNLVKTVEGARDFEQATLQKVVEARARIAQAPDATAPTQARLAAFQEHQAELSSALSRLLVVVERYPDLKATEAFRDLQRQLEGAENRIAVERRRFNEAARAYNTSRRRFPNVLIAAFLGFDEKAYFQSEPGTERPPTVDFSPKRGNPQG